MTKIAVIVGSLRAESWNKLLAKTLETLIPEDSEFIYADLNLPLLNQDIEDNPPIEVVALKTIIEAADGILIITPEYNRSVPGVLKNAIDWASRPFDHNSFKGKPIGIIGASKGQTGTAQAQSHLRNSMLYLDTKLLGQPELYISINKTFDENNILLDSSKEYLQRYIDTLIKHIKANKSVA